MFIFTRIPSWQILLGLIIFSGLTEGIGMSALIPILGTISSETNTLSTSFPFNIIPKFFNFVEIETSFLNLLFSCVCLIVATFFITYIQERILFKAKFQFLRNIRTEALDKLFASQWLHLSEKKSGELSNVLINETEKGAEALTSLLTMIAIGVQLLFYIIFTFILSWKMTLVSLLTLAISALFAVKLIRSIRIVGEESVKVDTHYNRFIVEIIRGAKLLKATATSGSFLDKVNKTGFDVTRVKNKILVSQSTLRLMLQVIIIVSMAFILILGVNVFEVSVNTLFIFMFVLLRLAPKTFTFHAQYHNFSAFKPALNIVDKLVSDAEKEIESLNTLSNNIFKYNKQISFKNVYYSYNNSKFFALEAVDVILPSNKIIGIAGRSGSGKTTFIDLVLGLLSPQKGVIEIDGINLNLINKNSYRNIISYVPQDNVFFDGTIKENITLGLKSINEKEIIKCIKIAQVDKFISSFPKGINTLMSEAGANMSGGQRQRIAIVRALLRKPKLLILDEATSSLDNEVESDFRKALEKSTQYSTLIIIAHRLSNLVNADLILVFDKGKIVQKGTYLQLKKDKGIFQKLLKFDNKTNE